MIRLIASDMDGTLLDSACRLPKDLFSVVRALKQRGVVFCAASGRQYASLREVFGEAADEITYICENGALIMQGGRPLFLDAIAPQYLPAIIAAGRQIPHIHAVICRADMAILEESAPKPFIEATLASYPNVQIVPDLSLHTHYTDVCKVAFYDEGDAQAHELPLLRAAAPADLTVTLSGYHWVDVMKPGVDKGSAMRVLQEKMGITPDMCMAFGDYLNDEELLKSVTHSYAMENAHPQLKAIAAHIAPSNDEDGVMRVIKETFAL